MKCNLFVAAIVAVVMAASAVCSADTFPDAYVRGGVGISKLPNINYTTTQGGTPGTFSVTSKDGLDVNAAFGAQFDNGWRAEGAFDYIRNKAKTLTSNDAFGSGTMTRQNSGVTKATTYMLNGLYDFDYQTSLTPYVGIGIGVASLIHDLRFDESGTDVEICYPAITFAGQGIIGVSFGWSDQVKISLDYRYLQTAKNKLPSMLGVLAGVSANRYSAHRVSIGLTTSI